MKLVRVALLAVLVTGVGLVRTRAVDWPQWRFSAGHTADSPEELSTNLTLSWVREFTPRVPVWEDPLNQDLMPYDTLLEPVVLGERMFVSFNDRDKLVALNIRSGRELWSFYADAPVRLAPAAADGKVCFVSDDGCLYCVRAEDGVLLWKFRGGPSSRKVLGNSRLVSAWPARGGPVIKDKLVYFAASIWPFMGTFICALELETGRVRWVNDSNGPQYTKQPHSAPAFGGVAPQGVLAATDKVLLVPGGRSVPAAFDRQSGQFLYFHLAESGKGNGGSLVLANESLFFTHTRYRGTRACELAQGKKTDFTVNEPVLGSNYYYTAASVSHEVKQVNDLEQKLKFERYDVLRTKEELAEVMSFGDAKAIKDSSNAWHSAEKKMLRREAELANAHQKLSPDAYAKVIQAWRADKTFRWEIPADGSGDLIRAGSRLYAAGSNTITVIELSKDKDRPERVWSQSVAGPVGRLLAANGMLFAVTLDGRILAFTSGRLAGRIYQESFPAPVVPPATRRRAETILTQTGVRNGYALCLGLENGDLITALAVASTLHLVGVDQDSKKVDRLRRQLDALGLYGTRISLLAGAPDDFGAPPYIASLVVADGSVAPRLADAATAKKVYESVRPYGGALWVNGPVALAKKLKAASMAQAQVKTFGNAVLVRREGALPGSADWTHQYGDVGNSVKSDDLTVKLPVGLLWFGGNTHLDVLPRHGHGPSPQVTGGRVFLEGMDCLSARDVYTGRRLWKTVVPGLNTEGVYYSETYTNDPLTTVFNQRHITGANGRGANFVATLDRVYVAVGNHCAVLDSATGNILMNIAMPTDGDQPAAEWGYIGVDGDVLLGGAGFAAFSKRLHPLSLSWPPPAPDLAASKGLVAFNRHTGRVLWRAEAHYSFIHNGLIAGQSKVYCLDRNPKSFEAKLKEQADKTKKEDDKSKKEDNKTKEGDEKTKKQSDKAPLAYRVVAFDIHTGQPVWEQTNIVLCSWLAYSKEHEVILLAGATATDRLRDETSSSMEVLQASDGAVVWKRAGDLKHGGPCILYHDTIITTPSAYKVSAGAYGLLDGKPCELPNPLTGQAQPWKFYRGYGCNYPIASEHLMTFRSGAAGFYDLDTHSGQGNWGGFKSSCSANLIVADGVLNAPDYTRTCSCPYQNQTSLGLIPMPEVEMWTCNFSGLDLPEGKRIKRLGLNLGAPGDRVAEDGTLWLKCPANSGISPRLFLAMQGGNTTLAATIGVGDSDPHHVSSAGTNAVGNASANAVAGTDPASEREANFPNSLTRSNFFRHHMSAVSGAGPAWVMASGVRNLRSLVVAPQTLRPLPPPEAPKDDDDEFDKSPGGATDDNNGGQSGIKDVTRKVTELVKDNTLSVDASNAILGDPAEGAPKKLRVEYSIDGVDDSKTVDENKHLTISGKDKSPSAKLVIRKAVYGDLANEGVGLVVSANGPTLIGHWLAGPTNLTETSGFNPPGTFDGVAQGTNAKALAWSPNVPPGFTGYSLDLRAGHVGVKIKHTSAKERGYRYTFDRGIASKLTVAFWANGYPGGWAPWVSKHGEGGEGWQVRDKGGSGSPTFTIRGTGDDDPDASVHLKDKPGWHHLAAVFDGVVGTRQLYVDGKLSLSLSNRFGKIGNAKNSSLELGARDGDAWFAGRLFDVRIYNYPLSAEEVTALLDPAAKDILSFDFEPLGEATISGTNISLTVEFGMVVTNLAPTFTIAPAATARPHSGTSRDFATPQTYTITARDGSTKDYTVTVIVAPPETTTDAGSTSSVASKRTGRSRSGPRRGLTKDEIQILKHLPTLPTTNYTVRLYFLEPDEVKPGQRVFDVLLQDRTVLSGFDVIKEAGGANRGVVKEFKHIEVTKDLELRLEKSPSASLGPVLSGCELILESNGPPLERLSVSGLPPARYP